MWSRKSFTTRNLVLCTMHLIKSRWAGHVAIMEEDRSVFKILTGKPIGRPRRRLKDSIRMYLKEIGVNTRNFVDSAQHWDYFRVFVNAALNLRDP